MSPMLTIATIAKNEEANIPRMIASVVPLTNDVLVVDTGSTDGTIEVAKTMGAHVAETPWVDFAYNLNDVLVKAGELGSDWILRLDADQTIDYIHPEFVSWLEQDAGADVYNVEIVEGTTTWRLPILMRGGMEWKFIGATHEYLDTIGREQRDLVGLRIRHHADGANRVDKFQRDIALLATQVDQGDPRAIFYTADAWRCLGDNRKAYALFSERAAMQGTWEEERWYAQYRAACAMLELDPAEGVHELMLAWQARPERSEPLMRIREFCDAQRIQSPSSDCLFVEQLAYVEDSNGR